MMTFPFPCSCSFFVVPLSPYLSFIRGGYIVSFIDPNCHICHVDFSFFKKFLLWGSINTHVIRMYNLDFSTQTESVLLSSPTYGLKSVGLR